KGLTSESRQSGVEEYNPGTMLESDFGSGFGGSYSDVDEEFDPVALGASELTMPERLMNDLRATLPSADLPLADYIIGNLDDRGFLVTSPMQLAREMGAP